MLDKALTVLAIEIKKIKASIKSLQVRPVLKDGKDGKRGFTGKDGKLGLPGKDGEKGDIGEDGPQGPEGPRGPEVLTVLKGDVGRDGPEGKVGPRGFLGDAGKQGEIGLVGPIGPPGPKGGKGDKGVSVTKISLENNMLFVWLDGVRRKIGSIKIPDTSVFIPGGGGRGKAGKNGGVRHTVSNSDPEPWTIANNRQATIHGELILEGDVLLENSAQLILEI